MVLLVGPCAVQHDTQLCVHHGASVCKVSSHRLSGSGFAGGRWPRSPQPTQEPVASVSLPYKISKHLREAVPPDRIVWSLHCLLLSLSYSQTRVGALCCRLLAVYLQNCRVRVRQQAPSAVRRLQDSRNTSRAETRTIPPSRYLRKEVDRNQAAGRRP